MTCRHKKRLEIERAMKEYAAEYKAQRTSMPIATFVRKYVKAELGYRHDLRSLVNHMEKHLGTKQKR